MQTMDNIDTQDNVATADTENTSVDSQEVEQAPETETEQTDEQEQPEQTEEQEKAEKQSRAQKRIQQLAREKAELQRKVAEYEQKQSAPKATDAPNIEDFDDYSEYQKAQQEYYVAQAEQRVLAKLEAEKAQQSQVEQQAEFETAISELKDGGVDVDGLMAKARYKYPFGKNGKVYRSAITAIRQRAGQQGDDDIFNAAGELIDMIDANEEGKKSLDLSQFLTTRTLQIENRLIRAEGDNQVIDSVSFSSEKPAVQWFGIEILSHAPDAIILDRAKRYKPC